MSQAAAGENIFDFFAKTAIFIARFSLRFAIGYREERFSH